MSTVTQKTVTETNVNKPPKLNFDLLESGKLPSQSKPWPKHELPVDVLLLTGETCELLSCLSHLNEGSIYKSYEKAIGHVFFGKIGEQNNLMKIAVIESDVEATDTSITVFEAIEELGPKAVFCVGFCGGLDDTKVTQGDVVLSNKVRTYASVSVMEEGIQDHNIGVPVPSLIGGIIKRADDNWLPPLENPAELNPIIHKEGVFLSGPEEVNNKKRCDELVKHFPDAVAIERQGQGLYKAAHHRNIQWVVIKGVSHFIDGRKPSTDSWKLFSSALAASITFNMLKDFYVFNQWDHYERPSQETRSNKKESWAGYQGSKRVESQTRPLVQVQPVPRASPTIATCTGTFSSAAQTQIAVVPQAQPAVLPNQQQVRNNPNNQVVYAAPDAIPVQDIVPQMVAQSPTPYLSVMVPTAHGIPVVPGIHMHGQVDVNAAALHGVPMVQPLPQITAPQRFFHPSAIDPPGTRLQPVVPSSRTTSHQQYPLYHPVGNAVVSTLQPLQNTPLQGGTQWPQYRQQNRQYQTQQSQQTVAVPTSETVAYDQQPKVNTPGWYPQPSQKRAADGDARQQRPAGFHKANKRLRS